MTNVTVGLHPRAPQCSDDRRLVEAGVVGAHRVAKRSQSGGCAADLAADLLTTAGGQPWPRGAPLGAVNVGATAPLGAPAAAVHVEEGGGGGGGSSREPTVRVDAADAGGGPLLHCFVVICYI